MTDQDIETYSNQKDNYRPLLVMLTITAIVNTIILFVSTSSTAIFAVVFIDLIAISYYYCNHNRYCDNCKAKMTKDYTNGLLCEKHYCEKCKTVIKMKMINARN